MVGLAALAASCSAPARHPNHVQMVGTANFRDLGGIATGDGHRVKAGVLYRSDELSNLTRKDLATFAELGVARVYDLRSDGERRSKPNQLPNDAPAAIFAGNAAERYEPPVNGAVASPVELLSIPVYYPPLDRGVTRRKIVEGKVEPGEFRRLMIEENRAFARDYRAQWAQVIRSLAEPQSLPALIHCAEGKDRTGFAVAMVLFTLGVPEEAVYEDYLLSNEFLGGQASFLSSLAAIGSWFRTPASEVRPLLEVRREFLEAGLETIKADYGSIEAYLEKGLGIDAATQERLRAALLE